MNYVFSILNKNTLSILKKKNTRLLPKLKPKEDKTIEWNTKKVASKTLEGIVQGKSVRDIAKSFQAVMKMDRNSALMNARTAVTSAQNQGRSDAITKANEDGIHIMKEWMATGDDRTRETHWDLDGEAVEYDESFITSEGNEIDFPGDPKADASEVCNCRCTLVERYVGFR